MAEIVTVPRRHDYSKIIKQYGIIPYDEDNLYPQRVANIITSSGAATTNIEWLAKFINGQGFQDVSFYKTRINRKGDTVDSFLRKIIGQYVKFGGFAVHFNFNMLGEKTEAQIVPFEFVRMKTLSEEVRFTGVFAVYNDWDRQKRRTILQKEIIEINEYNPKAVLSQIEEAQEISNYKGQLYYYFDEYGEYPLSPLDPELESCVVDSEIKQFNYGNVITGMTGAHIVEYPFDYEDEETRNDEIQKLKELQGVRDTARLLAVFNKNQDKSIAIHRIAAENMDKMFENTEKSTHDRIRRLFGVPEVFLDSVSSGLTPENISNAYDFYNAITNSKRIMFEEIFTEIFSGWETSINPSGNFKIQELKYIDEVEEQKAQLANTALNGAQVSSLVEIVRAKNEGLITREAAVQLIINAFPTITLLSAEKIVGQ